MDPLARSGVIVNMSLMDFLVCPQTGDTLTLNQDELYSKNTSYPLLNGIPWLFYNPEYAFLEWGTKIATYFNEEQKYIGYLQLLRHQASLSLDEDIDVNVTKAGETTLTRLTQLLEAKTHNLAYEQQLLAVFAQQNTIPLQPSRQQIQAYTKNIFRDWCWENTENTCYLEYIKTNSPSQPNRILVLGAGASKLSHLVASTYPQSQVYSVDHNPYLLFIAQNIFNQQTIALYDYCYFPNQVEYTHRLYNIQQHQTPNNHQFVLSSFPHLPFPPSSFDLVIAPWFYDILDMDLIQAIEATTKYMKPDATLIQIGPANMHHSDLLQQYTPEETQACYSKYFTSVARKAQSVEYLKNPIDSSYRVEQLALLTATTKKHLAELAPLPESIHQQQILKQSPAFHAHKQEIELTAQILQLIDQDITDQQLAKKIQTAFNLTSDQALFYASSLIKKLNMTL